MISILIRAANRSPVQNNRIHQIIKSFLRKRKIDNIEISLKFASSQEMRELNKKYRGIDKSATVLTFSQQEGQAFKKPPRELKSLGDIVICLEKAKKQSLSFEELLIHGLKNLTKFNEQRSGILSQISSSKNIRT